MSDGGERSRREASDRDWLCRGSSGALVQRTSQIVGAQAGALGGLGRRRGREAMGSSRGRGDRRGDVMEFDDVHCGTRLIGNVECEVILSILLSRGNRSSASRHSAGAQVRRSVAAPVAMNQVLPMLLGIARKRRRHGRVSQVYRVVSAGWEIPGGWSGRMGSKMDSQRAIGNFGGERVVESPVRNKC